MKYYRRYIGDYRRDTGTLSIVQHGVYALLMDEYYAQDGKLPLYLPELYRLCHATTKIERQAVMDIADRYFRAIDGKRHNTGADKELAIALPAIEKMREAGRLGVARKRAKSEGFA